ncbi:MAG: hypothetical protein LUQ50_07680 [Methanospirillum sp.]|uniref:CARDB domain-containing protein n=1 Tax=Methanospirillum sp. TaxID=45200 RepID=UPI002374EE72|nr:CARDB domain-containing protein [Methanospirillum sp.]MDD1728935.1 hypothetical protein [Methanospirillum sp.]
MQWFKMSILLTVILSFLLSGMVAAEQGVDIIGTRIVVPSSLYTGVSDEVQDFIRNDGSDQAGPFAIQYYLSRDPDQIEGQILIGTWKIDGLKPGARKYGNTTITVPSGTDPGEYYLFRWIDQAGAVAGEQSSNNIQRSQSTIHVITGKTGTYEGIGTIIQATGTAGSQIPVTVVINQTVPKEEESGLIYLFLSQGTMPDSSLISLGTVSIPQSPSPGEHEVLGAVSVPPDTAEGTYYVFTSFLPAEQVRGEGTPVSFWYNEDPIQITRATGVVSSEEKGQDLQKQKEPDVVLIENEQPDEAFIGDTFTITDSIKNVGGAEANIAKVEYLLSPDSDGTKGTHLAWRTVLSLKPDQTSTEQKQLGVPSYFKSGLFYLAKKIAVTAAIPEKDSDNNWWVSSKPIHIRYNPASPIPDLTHIRTVWPHIIPGESGSITDTITNIGHGCAHDVAIAYYLSPYQEFEMATAHYLGVWRLDSICPLEQKTNSTPVMIPTDLAPGEYYLYSVIDPCSFMPECGEEMPELEKSNNMNIGKIMIGPCAFC